MIGASLHRLDRFGRHLMPVAVAIMLMLIGIMPMPIPGYGMVVPPLTLMAIYYWAIHRPDLFRLGAAFALGLIQDLLSGQPLVGLTALCFVIVHRLAQKQRRFFVGHSFLMLWWGFAVTAPLVALLQWIGTSLRYVTWMPIGSLFFQVLIGIALFPPVAWIFIRLQRAFLPSR